MNAQPPGFSNPPLPGGPASLARAHRLLWLIFLLMVVTVGIGASWDKAYHATDAFDTVYSPPHLFIYSTVILTILLFEILVFSPGFRSWFGAGFRVPPLRFEVPGALVITGCGLAILGLAGIVLDNFWHSNFDLDETPWSTSHAMLGWAWFITMLGFVASRLALRPYRPIPWYAAAILGYLILGFSSHPLLGPFLHHTPGTIQATASIPTLAAQPPVQHASRIYLKWNLSQTNPLFRPLGVV